MSDTFRSGETLRRIRELRNAVHDLVPEVKRNYKLEVVVRDDAHSIDALPDDVSSLVDPFTGDDGITAAQAGTQEIFDYYRLGAQPKGSVVMLLFVARNEKVMTYSVAWLGTDDDEPQLLTLNEEVL